MEDGPPDPTPAVLLDPRGAPAHETPGTPAPQHTSTPAHQHTSSRAPQHTSTPAHQHTSSRAPQHTSTPAHQLPSTPAHQHTSTPAHQLPSTPAHRHPSSPAHRHPQSPPDRRDDGRHDARVVRLLRSRGAGLTTTPTDAAHAPLLWSASAACSSKPLSQAASLRRLRLLRFDGHRWCGQAARATGVASRETVIALEPLRHRMGDPGPLTPPPCAPHSQPGPHTTPARRSMVARGAFAEHLHQPQGGTTTATADTAHARWPHAGSGGTRQPGSASR